MLQAVRMPALGQTTDELRIIEWRKREGDPIEQGEPLLAVETDKATLEVEAFSSGFVRQILYKADDVVKVGTVVAYIGQLDDALPDEPPAPVAPPAAGVSAAGVAETVAATPPDGQKPLASPAVRALMREHGIDPRRVRGSGPGGRIERRDVEALLQHPAQSAADRVESMLAPVPHNRQIMAQRLIQ